MSSTQTIKRKVFIYAGKYGVDDGRIQRLQDGNPMTIDGLTYRDKAPDEHSVQIGEATIELTIFDQPVETSPQALRDQLAAVRERFQAEEAALVKKLTATEAWAPDERDLDDAKDLQRSEPRAERYKRQGEEA